MSRTAVATMLDAGDVAVDGVTSAVRALAGGDWLDITLPEPRRPLRRSPSRWTVSWCCTRTPTSSWSTSRSAWRPTRAQAGPGRPCSAAWRRRASAGDLGRGRTAGHRPPSRRRHHRGDGGGQERTRLLGTQGRLPGAHRGEDLSRHHPGPPGPGSGTIDAPIGRHPKADWKFAVVADGRDSITHYETLEAFRSASLVEVHLETGRTHQIRVHFSAMQHPLVGDTTYGADPVLARSSAWTGSGCTPGRWASPTRTTAAGCITSHRSRPTLLTLSKCSPRPVEPVRRGLSVAGSKPVTTYRTWKLRVEERWRPTSNGPSCWPVS